MKQRLQYVLLEHVRSHRGAYLLVVICFIGGVLLGSFTINVLNEQQRLELGEYINTYVRELLLGNIFFHDERLLTVYLSANIRIVTIFAFLGVIVIGLPLALFFVGLRGYIIGFSAGFLIYEKGLPGAFLAAASILPHHFVSVPGLLLAGAASVQFSSNLLYSKITRKPFLLRAELVHYCAIMFLALLFFMTAALVETYVTPFFIQLSLG